MTEPEPTASPAARPPGALRSRPGVRRATVSGPARSAPRSPSCSRAAGCARRSRRGPPSRPERSTSARENAAYLPGVQLPVAAARRAGIGRRGPRRLRVPGRALARVRRGDRHARRGRARRPRRRRLGRQGARAARRHCRRRPCSAIASAPSASRASAARRTRGRWCATARRSSPPPATRSSPRSLAQIFTRAGVVCEQSNDPIGVELAGAAKNAAALAAGATEAQGLNAAGRRRRSHLRRGVALRRGARRASGVDDRARRRRRSRGDRARAREPQPPRRRAARRRRARRGDPRSASGRRWRRSSRCRCSPARSSAAGVEAPVTSALGRLIAGELPLEDWVALVRPTVPPPALWRRRPQPGFWRRLWHRLSGR